MRGEKFWKVIEGVLGFCISWIVCWIRVGCLVYCCVLCGIGLWGCGCVLCRISCFMVKGEVFRDVIFLMVMVRFLLDFVFYYVRGICIYFYWVFSFLIWVELKEVKFGRILSELFCFVSIFLNIKICYLK